jgi:hypothetical protein
MKKYKSRYEKLKKEQPEKLKEYNKKAMEKTHHIRISNDNYNLLKIKAKEYGKTYDTILDELLSLI